MHEQTMCIVCVQVHIDKWFSYYSAYTVKLFTETFIMYMYIAGSVLARHLTDGAAP